MTGIHIVFVGVLACLILDVWQRLLLLVFKLPVSNWAIVGRWLVSFLKTGKWINNALPEQSPIPHELMIGWVFHYFIAVVYAFFYFILWWSNILSFEFFDGLVFGVVSVVVPWFFFMPAMGSGILAGKTDKPNLVCFLALCAHGIFGIAIALFFQVIY